MAILWELAAGRNFDPFGQAMRGYQAGSQQMREREKRSVLEQLAGSGMSYEDAARALLPYDTQAAGSLAQLGMAKEDRVARREDRASDLQHRDRQFQFQQDQANRQDRQWQASFGLQRDAARRADEAANRGTVLMMEDENGNKTPVIVNPRTGQMTRPTDPSGGPVTPSAGPINPYAPSGKTTDDQAKAGGYANRMVPAHNVITELEKINDGFKGNLQGIITSTSFGQDNVFLNRVLSPERQKQVQAMRDFVNAILRRESGAVISKDEFQNAARQYFPMPGDSPQVIEQKRLNREESMKGIMGAAGRGYRPPEAFRPSQAPRSATGTRQAANNPNRVAAMQEAEAAIAAGADPQAVQQRLIQMGF